MKRVIAIVLLCLPTQLSAGERCPYAHANRVEVARAVSVKPPASRAEIVRPVKVRAPAAWQKLLIFEQQIL